jgi:YVTN family beta-propeller protein
MMERTTRSGFDQSMNRSRVMRAKTVFMIAAILAMASPAIGETRVYVPLGDADAVLVIDADSGSVIGQIADVKDVHGLAGTPDGKFLVAGSYAEIQPGLASVPPKPAGISEDAHRAHHAKPAEPAASKSAGVSYLSLIRASDRSIVRRIQVPGAVHHTAVTPDGRYAIATHPDNEGVSVIDLSSYAVVKSVRTGSLPNYAVVGGDGKRVYVSNAGDDTVSEIDTASWTVRRNFRVGGSPEHLVLSPEGGVLYVNNVEDGTVSAVSLERGETVRKYALGGALHGIDLSDDGKTLFVSGREKNRLYAIDVATARERGVSLFPAPYHLTTIRGTGKLYVSSADEPKIWVVDQKTLRVEREIPIRGKGHQMVVVQR